MHFDERGHGFQSAPTDIFKPDGACEADKYHCNTTDHLLGSALYALVFSASQLGGNFIFSVIGHWTE